MPSLQDAASQPLTAGHLCRKSLPEDHPLCTCHSTTVLQRADQLALLHANLSAGKVTDISYALPSSDPQSRLGATLNSQGKPYDRATAACPAVDYGLTALANQATKAQNPHDTCWMQAP